MATAGAVKELTETQFLNVLRTRPKQPQTFIVTFSAKTADLILDRHGKLNRKISPAHYKQLASDMIGNRWVVNGETIIFDVDAKLEDGYHRMTGCAAFGTQFKTMVAVGVPKNSWQSIDQGRARSLANVLEWDGVDHQMSGKLQSVIRFCLIYEQDAERALSVSGPMGLAWLKQNPTIVDVLPLMKAARQARIGLKPTVVAGLYFEALKIGHDKDKVDEFFSKLTTGLNLSEGNPIYTLRKKMLNSVTTSRSGVTSDFTEHQQQFMIIRALNAFLNDEEMRQSRAPRKGERMLRIAPVEGDEEEDVEEA